MSGLGPIITGTDTIWLAAAMSDGDRQVAAEGVVEREGFRVRLLDLDPAEFTMAYDVIGNATLWFVHHHLYDLARRPRFDQHWRRAWDAYRSVNQAFAAAVAETAPADAVVLVQDYHLSLLAPTLAETRPDLRLVHFAHTPFAAPDLFGVLPDDVGTELLAGLAAHHACGFHTERWADSFADCCERVLGRRPTTFVSPLAPDPADIRAVAASEPVPPSWPASTSCSAGASSSPGSTASSCPRTSCAASTPSTTCSSATPAGAGRSCSAPSCTRRARAWPSTSPTARRSSGSSRRSTSAGPPPDWTPILLDPTDNFPRSVAALRRYDVLLVNPIRDGLNLVAKEGPLVNDHDGLLVLSPESGAWAELGDRRHRRQPLRHHRHRRRARPGARRSAPRPGPSGRGPCASASSSAPPRDWLAEQLAAAR